MKPAERGAGIHFRSTVSNDQIYLPYQRQVERTVFSSLIQGPLGWEVTDLDITLVDGEHHIEHTHPLDFIEATPMAIMEGLYQIGTTLLKPILRFRIQVPEEYGKRVLGDLMNMRGTVDAPVVKTASLCWRGIFLPRLRWITRLGWLPSLQGRDISPLVSRATRNVL